MTPLRRGASTGLPSAEAGASRDHRQARTSAAEQLAVIRGLRALPRQTLMAAVWATTVASGCSFDWDNYDPRLGDSSVDGGQGGAGPCGGVDVRADDFEDGLVDGSLWEVAEGEGADVSESGGTLRFSLPGGVPNALAAWTSNHRYDLTGRRLFVRAVETFPGSSGSYLALHAQLDSQNFARIAAENGQLVAQNVVAGHYSPVASVDYDPTAHGWWAVREDEGTLYWETSFDGETWQSQGQRPVAEGYPIDALRIALLARDSADSTAPGQAALDDLNGGSASGAWCPAATLSDDFEDGTTSIEWHAINGTLCTASELEGRLTLRHQSGDWRWCGYGSDRLYDLTGSSLTVELVSVPAGLVGFDVRFAARDAEDDAVVAALVPEGLRFGYELAGELVDYETVAYSAGDHRWLRIREQSGEVVWETSPDGVAWVTQFHATPPFALTALQTLLSSSAGSAGEACEVQLDNLNLPPS